MNRTEFSRISPEEAGISSRDILRFLDALESGHTEMHGLVIMRHGRILTEGFWAPYAQGQVHMCNSLTKTYMGTAIGIAIREGLLALDTRLIDIYPEYAPEEPSDFLQKLTIYKMLHMGTGMLTFPPDDADWVKNFVNHPILEEPGTTFHYSSVNSTLLGKIIYKLTGKNVYDYLNEKLFQKIGIDYDNLNYSTQPGGRDMWAWRTYSTTEDNLRLMKLYLDGGVVTYRNEACSENSAAGEAGTASTTVTERILDEEFVRLATTSRIDNGPAVSADGTRPPLTDGNAGYGFQMWMCRYPGAYRADGASGQFSIVIPDKDMIIAMNQHSDHPDKSLECIWDVLLPTVHDEPLPEDPEALKTLQRRLRHMAVESPAYQPYSTQKGTFSGSYKVLEGSFDPFVLSMSLMNDPASNPNLADAFTIRFGTMEGTLEWIGKDRNHVTLEFSMDGSRRYNRLRSPWEYASKCWANGWFETDTRFHLELMWPENDSTRSFVFDFTADGAEVSYELFSITHMKVIKYVTKAEKK